MKYINKMFFILGIPFLAVGIVFLIFAFGLMADKNEYFGDWLKKVFGI